MANEERFDVGDLSANELRTKLEERGLPTTGSKTVLRERLRGALEEDNPDDNEEAAEDIDSLTIAQLKDRFRNLDLKISGSKKVLRARLKAALGTNEESDEEENKSVSDHDTTRVLQQALTFKDVEDSLETFSGDGKQNVRRWINHFEETAELCAWKDVRKVIYAKRLMRGSAKLFVNFESCARSWSQLKQALLTEFGRTLNSRQVHKELSAARKKPLETYQEYIYRMLDSASHADMELEAKIQYIIDGVQDESGNKSILYGATTIKELRKRFSQYEALCINQKYKSKQATEDNSKRYSRFKKEVHTKRCYNCGDKKHMSNDCPSKEKGTKCFKCGAFGHIAVKCTKEAKGKTSGEAKETKVRCDLTRTDDKKTYKVVNILGTDVNAILDTGSDLHLIRASLYVALGAPTLDSKKIPFESIGPGGGVTLGSFIADIKIDENLFECQIHVLPDNYIPHDLLLGGELSDLVEIRIQ